MGNTGNTCGKSSRESQRPGEEICKRIDEDRQWPLKLGMIRNSNLHTKINLHYGEWVKGFLGSVEKERTIKSLFPSIMKDSYYDVKFEINFNLLNFKFSILC